MKNGEGEEVRMRRGGRGKLKWEVFLKCNFFILDIIHQLYQLQKE
jgi:hypothetical protein